MSGLLISAIGYNAFSIACNARAFDRFLWSDRLQSHVIHRPTKIGLCLSHI